jgi:hypothetical protein
MVGNLVEQKEELTVAATEKILVANLEIKSDKKMVAW